MTFSGFNTQNPSANVKTFYDGPECRTSAEAPVLTHQKKLPINSCVRDENASQASI